MTMGKEEEGERAEGFVRAPIYSVIHLPVVDVMCVLFWTQSVCMVPKQNTRNIYHKQMNNGVYAFLRSSQRRFISRWT